MYADQVLSIPPVGMDARPRVEASLELGPARSLPHAQDTRVVRPRASFDTLLAAGAFLTALVLTNPQSVPAGLDEVLRMQVPVQDLVLGLVLFALWPRVLTLGGVYEASRSPARSEILAILLACSVGSLLAFGFVAFGAAGVYTPRTVSAFWVLSIAATLTFRGFAQAVNTTIRSRVPRRVIVVGSGLRALRLSHELSAYPDRYELIGFVDDSDEFASEEIGRRMLGRLGELESILMRQVVDEVLIALPIKSCYSHIQSTIQVCERVGVESKYLADAFRCSLAKPRYEHGSRHAFVAMKVAYDDYRVRIKRVVDFVGALVGLVVLAPVMLTIAVLVKLTSPGPVIFAQERYGLNKRRFRMYKFRTMVPEAERLQAKLEAQNEAGGPVFKIRNDPRVTPIGRFLRKTSLDELPQLFNVLWGDMSLVGPRPLPVRDVQLFDQAWFMRRFSVRPGLTCLWQISGRSDLGFDDWITLDLKYIDEWSLALDFQILTRTIPAVVRGVGAA